LVVGIGERLTKTTTGNYHASQAQLRRTCIVPMVIGNYASGDAVSTKREEVRTESALPLIRYPGGKQRLLSSLLRCLAPAHTACKRFVEPFVGGGAVFFALNPKRA